MMGRKYHDPEWFKYAYPLNFRGYRCITIAQYQKKNMIMLLTTSMSVKSKPKVNGTMASTFSFGKMVDLVYWKYFFFFCVCFVCASGSFWCISSIRMSQNILDRYSLPWTFIENRYLDRFRVKDVFLIIHKNEKPLTNEPWDTLYIIKRTVIAALCITTGIIRVEDVPGTLLGVLSCWRLFPETVWRSTQLNNSMSVIFPLIIRSWCVTQHCFECLFGAYFSTPHICFSNKLMLHFWPYRMQLYVICHFGLNASSIN